MSTTAQFHSDLYMQVADGQGHPVATVFSRTNSVLALSQLRGYVGAPERALHIPNTAEDRVTLTLVGAPRTRAMACVGFTFASPYYRMEWETRNLPLTNHVRNFFQGVDRAR